MINFQLTMWLLWLLVAAPDAPRKQVLHYTVMGKGDSIGHLTIHREIHGERIRYRSLNETSVRMLKSFHIRHELEAVYDTGKLSYAEVTVQVNDNLHHQSRIEWREHEYIFFQEGEETDRLDEPVDYSSIQLYFEEPQRRNKVFSEQFGKWQTIEPVQEDASEYILDKESKSNRYRYEDGLMTYAEVGHWLMSTELHLKKRESS